MSDKYEYLKKVIDKLHYGKYYESDFSSTDVEIAMRELKAICQSLPLLSPDIQVGQQEGFLHFKYIENMHIIKQLLNKNM